MRKFFKPASYLVDRDCGEAQSQQAGIGRRVSHFWWGVIGKLLRLVSATQPRSGVNFAL